jgi:hypothetical protein
MNTLNSVSKKSGAKHLSGARAEEKAATEAEKVDRLLRGATARTAPVAATRKQRGLAALPPKNLEIADAE